MHLKKNKEKITFGFSLGKSDISSWMLPWTGPCGETGELLVEPRLQQPKQRDRRKLPDLFLTPFQKLCSHWVGMEWFCRGTTEKNKTCHIMLEHNHRHITSGQRLFILTMCYQLWEIEEWMCTLFPADIRYI